MEACKWAGIALRQDPSLVEAKKLRDWNWKNLDADNRTICEAETAEWHAVSISPKKPPELDSQVLGPPGATALQASNSAREGRLVNGTGSAQGKDKIEAELAARRDAISNVRKQCEPELQDYKIEFSDCADVGPRLVKCAVEAKGYCGSQQPTSSAARIRADIDQVVRSGQYKTLEPPTVGSGGRSLPAGHTLRTIENQTRYRLRVLLSGPADREIELLPGAKESLILPAGSYKVLARVSFPSVLPLYAEQVYLANVEYVSYYYVP